MGETLTRAYQHFGDGKLAMQMVRWKPGCRNCRTFFGACHFLVFVGMYIFIMDLTHCFINEIPGPSYSREHRAFFQIWHKHPLGLNDELIRIWWSWVKVTVTSQNMFLAIIQEFMC